MGLALSENETFLARWYLRIAPKAFLYRSAISTSMIGARWIAITEQSSSHAFKQWLEDLITEIENRSQA